MQVQGGRPVVHRAEGVCFSSFLVLFFYVGVLFLPGFSCNRIAVLKQSSSDSQAVCYIFLKNSQLSFRIYSGFSRPLCVDRVKPH